MGDYKKVKLKFVANIYNGNSIPDDQKEKFTGKLIPYIPTKELNASNGTINYDNGLSVDEEDGFKLAPKNSVLLCIEGGSAGKKVGFTDRRVAFVNKLCCLFGNRMNPKYLYYGVRSKDFTDQFFLNISGLIGGVTVSELKNLYISIPNDETTQNSIVEFLDSKIVNINALIENQEAQIEKLKQYKQSLITEVVTKGLDPDAPMKDSGVEWIGSIPHYWSMIRKLSLTVEDDISYGIVKLFEPDDANGVKVIRCSDVLEGIIDPSNIRTVTRKVSDEYGRTVLKGGEVLVNVRGSLGGCAVVPVAMAGYNIAREVARITLKDSFYNRYVMYYMLSNAFTDYRTRYLSGSVYIGLNIELLSFCPLPMPSIKEQKQICDFLDKKCKKIDKLIEIKKQKNDKLSEYIQSLNYEYVTGKKEVV